MSTRITYVGNGVTTNFTFPFDYLRKAFVKVLVDAVDTPYTFITSQSIQITPAPGVGKVVVIRRDTDKNRLVTFVDGSILIANDLNVAAIQALHIAAEAYDEAAGSLLIDADGAYSAGFRRISDLGAAVNPNDAVSKTVMQAAIAAIPSVPGPQGIPGAAGAAGSNGVNGLDFPALTTIVATGAISASSSHFSGNKLLRINSATPVDFSVNLGAVGTEPLLLLQGGVGQVTVAGLASRVGRNGFKTSGQYAVISIIPLGVDAYLVAGDTAV